MRRRTAALARQRRAAVPRPAAGREAGNIALNDRLVRERDRERARELLRLLALGVAVLVPLLLHVWQQVVFMETAYRIEDLRSDRARMERRLRALRLERAALESLDRIEARARSMGMVEPPVDSVFTVRPAPQPQVEETAATAAQGGPR